MSSPRLRRLFKQFYKAHDLAFEQWEKRDSIGPANLPPFPEELRGMTCGAKTRAGTPCKQKGIYRNGRCKLHGGLSTGPRTKRGKRRSSLNWKKRKIFTVGHVPHEMLLMLRFKDSSAKYRRGNKNEVHDRFTKRNIESKKLKNNEEKPYKKVNLPQGTISGRPDFRTMAKCQAKAKSTGQRCKNIAMKGKRVCYLHGGKSTGAKTPEGKRRSKYARLQHGDYSAQVKQNRRKLMWINRISKLKGLL